MHLTNLPISKRQKLIGRALAFAAALGSTVLVPQPARAQWADCASAPANSKQCVPSGSGNVGIGTTSPQAKLNVSGTTVLSNGTGDSWFPYGDGNSYVSGTNLIFRANGNTEFMRLTSSGNVGIGTASPLARLTVNGDGSPLFAGYNILQTARFKTSANGAIVFDAGATGTYNLRGMEFDYATTNLRFGRYDSTGASAPIWDMALDSTGNIGIGTVSPARKLDVNGTIGAREVVVTNTGWADYVFKPGYKLRPLSEVADFIKDNGHLPEIPSEAEVKQNGVSMGEMQAKLLAKVEELTLHLIEEQKRNAELQRRVERLEAKQL